jgi:hypothetical protein
MMENLGCASDSGAEEGIRFGKYVSLGHSTHLTGVSSDWQQN